METKNYPFKTEDLGDIILTPEYWDCECEKDYIHPKSQKSCKICGAKSHSQPDARANEVMRDIYHTN